MEQILKDGAKRESRTELKIPTFGAIGLGVGLVIRGLFRGRR